MLCASAAIVLVLLWPVRAEITRTFSVSESAETGHRVGYIEGTSLPPDTLAYVIVLPPESGVQAAFSVSPHTGEITTKRRLDFELQPSYVFLAIPADGSEGIRVVINVQDENDNAPTFPVPSFDVKLSEYAKLNAEVPLVSASDPDSGVYSVQKYRILEGNVNNAFRLSVRELSNILYLDLIVNGELDREFRDSYQLTIEAIDGGNPPRTGSLLVNITIVDANDNAPEFAKPRYATKVNRNVTVGTKVVSVAATDRDVGPNARITYKLLPVPSNIHKRFNIDSDTGVITVAEPLTSYRHSTYELIVIAADSGIQPLESTTFVTITVTSKSRMDSDIKILFLSADGSPTIAEDVAVGSLVARVSVGDMDDPSLPGHSANLTASGHQGHFQLRQTNRHVHVLVVAKALDRERLDRYTIELTWTGPDGAIAERQVVLTVTDVNDNHPRFTQNSFEAEVRESAGRGASVLQLTATDLDLGENGRVGYAIANTSSFAHWFHIDAETGLITSSEAVDCEVSSRPELMVVATDNGNPPLSAMTKVVITVLDYNDNAPLFQRSVYNVTLAEDEDVGNCFLKVHAIDPDCGVNSQVVYTMREDAVDRAMFSVDRQSGTVCLRSPLDYETKRWHQFAVLAHDGGGLSSSATVRLNVEDVDDNTPVFYPSHYNVSVRENMSPGQPLATLSATDADDGVYGRVTYTIVDSSADSRLFRVDAEMGELYVKAPLRPRHYQVDVRAEDGGGRRSARPARVGVSVLPADYPSPVFERKLYRFTVTEDTLPSIEIGAVSAVGPGPVTYTIYSGDPNGWFAIDRTSGAISVQKDLDGDRNSSLLLNIQAAIGQPPSYNHTQVRIEIEDVNDNAPYFETKLIKTSVREDHPLNSALFTIQASDRDRGRNSDLTYQLLSIDPPNAPFLVRPRTGEIMLVSSLDYETERKYRLLIRAADGGIPYKSANITVEIDIMDANDHTPTFNLSSDSVVIAEDAAVLSRIYRLQAVDGDGGKNGQISYSLADASEGRFGVHGETGWVYVRRQLDREIEPFHRLIGIARDHGTPPLEAQFELTVTLLDVNDNAPNCASIPNFVVPEHQKADVLIGYITAFDPDEGSNGSVSYKIERGASDLFRITPNGELYAKKALDAETESTYELTVVVADGGVPPKSSDCVVRVTVADENDNAPFFVLPHQNRFFVREEQPIGTEVVQVRANDPDKGLNGTVTYAIANHDVLRYFAIGEIDGVISTVDRLDFDTLSRTEFRIEVIAKDKGTPSLSSTKILHVEILDVADIKTVAGQDPQLLGGNATVTFEASEASPVGAKLGPIDAERAVVISRAAKNTADEALLDTTFEIVGGNSQGLFEIDRLSSDLYLIKPLDYETTIVHSLRIQRSDLSHVRSSPVPNVSLFEVRVTVTDENDNVPMFPEDPVIFSTSEDAKIGLVIWRYNATDADMGANGRIQYSVVEQTPEAMFEIDPVTGELWVTAQLDRERFDEYLVVVAATDQSSRVAQRRTSKVTTRIYVTDVNDNRPTFQSSPVATVFENEPAGGAAPFFHVVATDPDFGQNGLVAYALSSTDKGYFSLNTTSGALALRRRLDRESPKQFSLELTAYDHGASRLSSTQTLVVNVHGVNADAPRFFHSLWRANVTENLDAGAFVVKLLASDYENGGESKGGQLLYVVPKSEGSAAFTIDERSGVIETAVALDREQKSTYSFAVFVHDSSNHGRYDVATVEVNVMDRNDNAPQIAEASCLPLSVSENRRINIVHKMIALDADTNENGRLRYSIEGGNSDNKFQLNPTTGELSCDRLDYETKSLYNLTVMVRDGGRPTMTASCSLLVTVLNENDEAPSFPREVYETEMNEMAPLGTTVIRLSAAKRDANIVYSVADDLLGVFEINPHTGDLYNVKNLDFEKENQYAVVVRATDLLSGRSSESKVNIRVTDVNDHEPIFTQTPFRVKVPDTLRVGQRIIKVLASDSDSRGRNSDIYYSFQRAEEDLSINPRTGVISAKTELRLAHGSVRYIGLFASDQGVPPLRSAGIVEMTVESNVVTAPDPFSLVFPLSEARLKVSENSRQGTTVGQLQARRYNAGSGNSQVIEHAIIGGNERRIFGIDKWTGRIYIINADELDYETQPVHRLLVEASALPPATIRPSVDQYLTYATAIVEVEDVNDSAPRFLQPMYATAVQEGQPSGTFVVQISASDADEGENSRLTYSIVRGNLDSAFSIDASGLVRTSTELDREILEHYILTVMATDAGQPPLSGETQVKVTVLDRNDNVPSFPPLKNVSISERTAPGTLVAVVTANDVDSSPPLEYRLIPSGDPVGDNTFAIDRHSGRITTQTTLDYEKRTVYKLDIEVSDQLHTSSKTIWVALEDENDNAPVFEKSHYQVSLPEDSPAGASIIRVVAHDADSGNNGFVNYRFSAIGRQAQTKGFSIDQTTGSIFTETPVEDLFGTNSLIRLTVEAWDAGVAPKSSFTSVVVHVVSRTKQRQPKLSQQFYTFKVREDAAIHSTVGQVSLTSDTRDYPDALYSINTGNNAGLFHVAEDGTIVLRALLDREQRDEYRLTISVVTKTNSISNSTATVLIQVEDVNDNVPQFGTAKLAVTIDDRQNVGDEVLQISATDRDEGDNGKITYEITSGNEQGLLAIDKDTGSIMLAKKPGRQPLVGGNPKRLVVKATDGGVPSKSTITTIALHIPLSSNDRPFFPVRLHFGAVPENAAKGTLVFAAKATTSGSGSDSQGQKKLKYSLIGENAQAIDVFQINEINGEVRTAGFFDYETETDYRFSIRAVDEFGRSAEVPAHVLVKGVDEYAPEFSQQRYAFKVSYDAEPGTKIGVIYATDKDQGADKQFRFFLKQKSTYFEISELTGVLTVRQSLKQLADQTSRPSLRVIRSVEPQKQEQPVAIGSSAQLIAEDNTQDESPEKRIIYLTVLAMSSFDSPNPKTNSTLVVLELGNFPSAAAQPGKVGATIITVTSAFLVLLLILVLLFLFLMLRRKQTKTKQLIKHTTPYPNQQNDFRGSERVPSAVVVTQQRNTEPQQPSMIQNYSVKRASPAKHTPSPERNSLPPPPLPPVPQFSYRRQQQPSHNNSGSDPSNKSSGRGSAQERRLYEEDEEIRRLQSATQFEKRPVTSMPDSGIDPEDDLASLASDYPSAQDYLTSLGVTERGVGGQEPASYRRQYDMDGRRTTADEELDADAAEDAELKELIYSKVNEVLSDEGGRPPHAASQPPPAPVNFLASPIPGSPIPAIMNRSLQHHQLDSSSGPSYQPLTQVFSEIAKLKNSTLNSDQQRPRPPPNSLALNDRPETHYHSTPVGATTPKQWGMPNFRSPVSPLHGNNNNSKYALSQAEAEVEIKI